MRASHVVRVAVAVAGKAFERDAVVMVNSPFLFLECGIPRRCEMINAAMHTHLSA